MENLPTDLCDRPDAETEIEVTPEMIEAGLHALSSEADVLSEWTCVADRTVGVKVVFRAMDAVAPYRLSKA